MKKIIILIILNITLSIILGMFIGISTAIYNVEILNIDSGNKGSLITIECCGQEFNYYYEK